MKMFPTFLLVLLGVALVCHGAQGAEAEASSNTGSFRDGGW